VPRTSDLWKRTRRINFGTYELCPFSETRQIRGRTITNIQTAVAAWLLPSTFRLSYIRPMKNEPIPGLKHEETCVTTFEMRARQLSSDVLSSPAMIGLMERTCVELLAPYLDESEQTVGFHVDVKHFAPTKIGQSVTVTAELLELRDGKLRFAVKAWNDQGVKIGEGFHRRALINANRFAKKE
jgi:fluoroacetyl-CoA thioesterase